MKKHLFAIVPIGLLFIATVVFLSIHAATALPRDSLREPLPKPALKELAREKGIEIGNYAALKRLGEPGYSQILKEQFDFVTIDGQPNWQFNDGLPLRPGEHAFDFTNTDKVMEFARANNKPVRMHHYVWGEEKWIPDWVKKGDYTKEELLGLIENHIKTVGDHFKGKVREWTVVNEAFTRGLHQNGLNDWWGEKIGPDYIDQSFIWARQADPGAKLIMNDFNNERPNEVSDAMYEYIKGMKARNVPIDGIGMQMHIDGNNPPKKEDVIKNMQRFAAIGLGVYVTEFDVTVNDFHGSEEEKQTRQAVIYHDMLRACVESGVCKSFALLGITDKETWYNELCCPASNPLPFDDNYNPKPAFWAMREALRLP